MLWVRHSIGLPAPHRHALTLNLETFSTQFALADLSRLTRLRRTTTTSGPSSSSSTTQPSARPPGRNTTSRATRRSSPSSCTSGTSSKVRIRHQLVLSVTLLVLLTGLRTAPLGLAGKFKTLLTQDEVYGQLVLSFLDSSDNPRIAWIHDLAAARYEEASRSLLQESDTEFKLADKQVSVHIASSRCSPSLTVFIALSVQLMLSISKLCQVVKLSADPSPSEASRKALEGACMRPTLWVLLRN